MEMVIAKKFQRFLNKSASGLFILFGWFVVLFMMAQVGGGVFNIPRIIFMGNETIVEPS